MLGKNLIQAAAGNAGAVDTAWNVSNAVYNGSPNNWFYVGNEEATPTGVAFKSDGTKMYVIGSSSDSVHEYAVSTAWDVSTATYTQSFSVATQETTPEDLTFKPDGTQMYVVGSASDSVHQYTLSTAWDISSASFTRTLSVSAQTLNPSSIFFRPNGLSMYIADGTNALDQYTLSTAWDISTATYTRTDATSTFESFFFKDDGTKTFHVPIGASTGFIAIREYPLTTAWDISTTGSATSTTLTIRSSRGIFMHPDGTKLYIADTNSDVIYQLDLTTAWDSTTATFIEPTSDYFFVGAGNQTANPQSLFFKPDGTRVYLSDGNTDDIKQYSLSTAWDISTASFQKSRSLGGVRGAATDLIFKDDGTRFYVLSLDDDSVHEYTVSTAWDIGSFTWVQAFSVTGKESNPKGLTFKDNGAKMYVTGLGSDSVHEYNLSTPWDISTSTFNQTLSVSAQAVNPEDVKFKTDGTKMYLVGGAGIVQYDLSTAWDISTATYSQAYSISTEYENSPTGMAFKDDGIKLYFTGFARDVIWSLDL